VTARPPRPARRNYPRRSSADELHAAILELAREHGWLVLEGASNILVLIGPERLAIVALRAERERLDVDTQTLLAAARRHGRVLADVWRPSDLPDVRAWFQCPQRAAIGRVVW
jgi:hypothetical protein